MIKTFLKHLFLEKCIDILFDGIQNSFSQPDMPPIIENRETEHQYIKTIKRYHNGKWYTGTAVFEKSFLDQMNEFHISWNLSRIQTELEESCEYVIKKQIEHEKEEIW